MAKQNQPWQGQLPSNPSTPSTETLNQQAGEAFDKATAVTEVEDFPSYFSQQVAQVMRSRANINAAERALDSWIDHLQGEKKEQLQKMKTQIMDARLACEALFIRLQGHGV